VDRGLAARCVSGSAHRLAVNGDHSARHAAHRAHPGDKAALELLWVENGQDITEVAVVRCAILERAEAAKEAAFLDAEEGRSW